MFERPEWETSAPCAQVGGDLWFPPIGDSGREAKQICQRCPFTQPCLEGALERHERFGIWGGVAVAQVRKGGQDGQVAA